MTILNATIANELLVNGALNPKFFGVTSTPSQSTVVSVKPDPITTKVTVTPPPVVRDGFTVTFPPYATDVVVQAPPVDILVPSVGGDLKNTFESVGVISVNGQQRLCALVRPHVIAAARHYNNPPFASYIGGIVRFTTGELASIVGVALTRDDFECYYLDRPIATVQPAAIAPLEPNLYTAREIIMFGLGDKVRPIAGRTALKYAFGNGPTWMATASNKVSQPLNVQSGDSGSPVFITANGVVQYFGSIASINLTETKINMACPHSAEIAAL